VITQITATSTNAATTDSSRPPAGMTQLQWMTEALKQINRPSLLPQFMHAWQAAEREPPIVEAPPQDLRFTCVHTRRVGETLFGVPLRTTTTLVTTRTKRWRRRRSYLPDKLRTRTTPASTIYHVTADIYGRAYYVCHPAMVAELQRAINNRNARERDTQ